MNTLGIVAIGIGLVAVAVMRSVRSLRAEIAEMKSSLALVMREIESHEWQVRNFEPPGKWRDELLVLLASAKESLFTAQKHARRVHFSTKAQRGVLDSQRCALAYVRNYHEHKEAVDKWRKYLQAQEVSTIAHA